MTKKKIIIIVILAIIIAVVLYFIIRPKTAPAPVQTTTENQRALHAQKTVSDIMELFENKNLKKYGFAVSQNQVCFVDDSFTPSVYDINTKATKTISSKIDGAQSAKVAGTADACIFQIQKSDSSDLYRYYQGKTEKLDANPSLAIGQNGQYFTAFNETTVSVFDQTGQKIKDIPAGQDVFKLAPVSSDAYFSVQGYDAEVGSGYLAYVAGDKTSNLVKVNDISGLYANSDVALYIFEAGDNLNANLVDKSGKIIKTIQNVNPDAVYPVDGGFYFATTPGGNLADSNEGNMLGFVSNSGEVKALLNTIDETENQFNIDLIQKDAGIVYFEENSKVYSLKAE